MKKYLILLSFLFFLFAVTTEIFAVQANTEPQIIKQPDGTEITVRVKGDEFYSWIEDSDGYTVVQDKATNVWSYAEKDFFGELKPSKYIVGKDSPKMIGIQKSLKDDNEIANMKQIRDSLNSSRYNRLTSEAKSLRQEAGVNKSSAPQSVSSAAMGTKTNFVLLIQFSDLKFNQMAPFYGMSDAQIINIFNKMFNDKNYSVDGAIGSVYDYFYDVSYKQLTYNSVISPIIITIPDSYLDYAYNKGSNFSACKTAKMIETALYNFHNTFGYSNFLRTNVWQDSSITEPQGFTVIHAGGGAEASIANREKYIWSHQWDLSDAGSYASSHGYGFTVDSVTIEGITFDHYHTEPAGRGTDGADGFVRIGTICHESLHFFGLPDLYDVNEFSTGQGLGNFSIMAGGSWNGISSSERSGRCPCHPDVWCKYKLGWIKPLSPSQGINYIGDSAKDSSAFYKFTRTNSSFPEKQYFLMENRQLSGYDRGLPGPTGGILIYHIDEALKSGDRWHSNGEDSHYIVRLEEADGTADWTRSHLVRGYNQGLDSDYYRSGTTTVFNDSCVSSPNSRSYEGTASGINIAGISGSSSNMAFAYGNVDVYDDLSNVLSYPNPARNGYMYITNLPITASDFSAEVFTIKGNLVKNFSQSDIEFAKEGDTILGKIKWLLNNDNGANVAPGVYIVMIKANNQIKKYKVAVIR